MRFSARIARGCLWAVLAFALPARLAGAPRVAIIAPEGFEEPAILLTSALSSRGEFELMERDQLDSIVREKNLRSQLGDPSGAAEAGKILGVDALILFSRSSSGFSARSISTGSAVVLGEFGGPWPLEEPQKWAEFAARNLAPGLLRAPASPGEGILLSLAAIRSSLAGARDQNAAREVSFVLNRSLSGVPGLFLLDRSSLREAEWENQLAGIAPGFWASSWLFDATVSPKDRGLILDGRLRQIPGDSSREVHLEADSAAGLGEAAAAEIARLLQKTAVPQTGAEEGSKFLEEAEWALRWNLFDQAERSADAAWFLGAANEKAAAIRAIAAAKNSHSKVAFSCASGLFSTPPPPAALEEMVRAFSSLAAAKNLPGGPSPHLAESSVEIVAMASDLLKAYYYLPRDRTPEEDEMLRWLRGQIREMSPGLLQASYAAYEALKPYEKENLVGSPNKFPARFFVEAGWYAPLWNETPETSAKAFEAARDALDKLSPALREDIISAIVQEYRDHKPLVVAWDKSDRNRVSPERQNLLRRMAEKDPRARVDALTLQLNQLYLFGLPAIQKTVPRDRALQAISGFYGGLAALRSQIIKGELSADYLGRSLDLANNFVLETNYASLKPDADAGRRALLLALLGEGWPGNPEIYNRLVSDLTFTPSERDGILRSLDRIPKKRPDSFLASLGEMVANQTSAQPQASTPAPAKETPARRGPPATASFPLAPEEGRFTVDAFGKDDICIAISFSNSPDDGLDSMEILEFDFATGRKSSFKIPDPGQAKALYFARARDFDDARIYFSGPSQLYYVDRGTGKVGLRAIPVLSGHPELLRAIRGKLYAALAGGAIAGIDPGSFSVDLLASAQRRPAQTPLDDRPPYSVNAIFEWDQDVAFLIDRDVWRWNESSRTFQKSPQNAFVGPGKSFDRGLFLKWIEAARAKNDAHWMLLLDDGTGRVPSRTGSWPPFVKLQGGEKFPPDILGTSACGSDFVVLFVGGVDRGTYLRVARGSRVFVVPLPVENADRFSDVIALRSGVAIWGRAAREIRFYSYADLEKFAASP